MLLKKLRIVENSRIFEIHILLSSVTNGATPYPASTRPPSKLPEGQYMGVTSRDQENTEVPNFYYFISTLVHTAQII